MTVPTTIWATRSFSPAEFPKPSRNMRRRSACIRRATPTRKYNLGQGYLQMGKLPEAIAHGVVAVRLAPANPEAHNNLGMALARSGRAPEAAVQFQEAIVQYHEVLRSDPADPRMRNGLAIAYFNAGNLLAQAGKMPEAIAHFEQALQFKADLPEAQLNWGNALLAEGQTRRGHRALPGGVAAPAWIIRRPDLFSTASCAKSNPPRCCSTPHPVHE